ncbi:MAG: radical SAM protein [Novosphingobium sp.]|nr:radical SAM protein [Novosphingobium sp.]
MDLSKIGFYTLYNDRVKNVSEFSQMKRCEMIITEYCNFKCPYCRGLKNEIYGDRSIKELSIDEIKRNIDYWCMNEPLENIRFSGGEPTIHKNIIDAVKYSKQKGIKHIAISTNGSNSLDLYKSLIREGVNDFSVSLDACCAEDGDKMSGGIKGAWDTVISNIRELSQLVYVTVGIVFTPDNIEKCIDTIKMAHQLGVADIRIISSAQWNGSIPKLNEIPQDILDAHPILKYRVNHFITGRHVRGIKDHDCNKCPLVLDDTIIAGDYFFPCVIYMREQGQPIGKVNSNMREQAKQWFESHNTHNDDICRKNCLDVCIDYNNTWRELNA